MKPIKKSGKPLIMTKVRRCNIGVVLINELAIGLIFAFVGYKVGTNKEKLVSKAKDAMASRQQPQQG